MICNRGSVLKISPPWGPILTKTKNICKKKKTKKEVAKIKKMSEGMAQGKQQPKFKRNPCIRLRGNCIMNGQTDGRRRTNCDFMSSTDIVKQS